MAKREATVDPRTDSAASIEALHEATRAAHEAIKDARFVAKDLRAAVDEARAFLDRLVGDTIEQACGALEARRDEATQGIATATSKVLVTLLNISKEAEHILVMARGENPDPGVPAPICPNCQQKLDGRLDLGELLHGQRSFGAPARPGDLTVCANCQEVLTFTPQMSLRSLTTVEEEIMIRRLDGLVDRTLTADILAGILEQASTDTSVRRQQRP